VRRLHGLGVGATAAGRPAIGARHLRAGLRLLGRSAVGDASTAAQQVLAARLLISLAHAEAEQGRTELGLRLLDEAETLVAPEERGVLLQQRGLALLRTGQTEQALGLLDAAVPLLTAAGDVVVLARTLLNRSVVRLGAGRVRLARDDLRECERIARANGLDLLAAKAMQNLGYCDLYTGDIPSALEAFETAARGYARHGPGILPVLALDKARALLAAGLPGEAGRELDNALVLFRQERLSQDYAEAELTRAQAALDAGEFRAAREWARRAERRFRRRGNSAWAALAALMQLRAEFQTARTPSLAARAGRLADRLRLLNLAQEAEVAGLLAIRALVAAGRTSTAHRRATQVVPAPHTSMETRLLRRLTRAELALAQGRRGEALTQLRAGLATLQDHRSRFGSLDFQTSTAALGSELALAGLDAALDDGSPGLVFAWSERSRAQAFRLRPVRASADTETAEAVVELRQLSHALRTAELSGRSDPQVRARCVELERRIREHGWRVPGTGESLAAPTLAMVAAELAATDRMMVSFLSRHGRLLALLIHNGSAHVVGLGDYAAVEEALRRLLADLNAQAGRNPPARLVQVIRDSIRQQLSVLTEQILAPLRALLGDHDIVVVPTMSLSGLPWGLLPDLRGRPVTVAPSAAAWLAARRPRRAGDKPVARPPLLVAGPDLSHADREITEITKVYPQSRSLRGLTATVEATLHALEGAQIAHLAAHGHHERENVLFSRLDLVDGPLMAYDVQQLTQAPHQVVLSACDVGRTVVRAGDEILGFTAALLYAGTANVVSCVARVPDEAAASVMVAYHREIAAGVEPARALATASLTQPLVSFNCFGSG
jgi:CHAT domain-containing protein